MPTVELGGSVRLAYEIRGGPKEPTVLVHGSWVDRHTWDRLVGPLSQGVELITYDRRGHGESTGPLRRHPVRDDAADLAGLLEAIDVHPVHVVGHSYGAAVAFRLAHDRPEMVRSLSVHEPPYIGLLAEDPATAGEAARVLADVARLRARVEAGDPEEAARGVVDALSLRPGAWERLPVEVRAAFLRHAARWCEESEDPDLLHPDRAALHELLLPILLTSGELSPPYLRATRSALEPLLRNVVARELPETGHVPHLTSPAQYVGLLVTFLLERNVPVT